MTTFGYAATPYGQIHYAECGAGEPVLLLHQTPRSWDEYREVLPLLGGTRRAIAMDTLGFGNSARIAEHSIEAYADGVLALAEALDLGSLALVGHHTGGVVAVEAAARAPELVSRLVLSSTPLVDEQARARRRDAPAIDAVAERPDGSHLSELWNRRAPFYPLHLLTRFVRDALAVWPEVEDGHRAVSAYRMEERLGLIRCPVLCVGASADPFAFPELARLTVRLPYSTSAVIEGGMVPLEHQAEQFATIVEEFLCS
ncbi:alpha/beta fold hydrolase [Nonomuraea soli]|uniref:Pimeloyl-ACP methyl ester carboxylesterase n=1 Tax=Nonomuraea soli TaxID=1032476 RepID=A0A7W0CFQ2_9ACTN|nr:alpha/beta hydrolase [Nonomuraea soli]MBA2890135.1 pimeloyl-ACP methyl ester carboxylesterase [Nonomuraea soli]